MGITGGPKNERGRKRDSCLYPVWYLANKCPGITHAIFGSCTSKLTDAAVIALADNCPGITHANFGDCKNLTDAQR
eukprot:gene7581-biopygen30908